MSDPPSSSAGGNQKDGESMILCTTYRHRFLPISKIARIMKRALPANAMISKDAKDMMQECVTEFISLITSEASELCYIENINTIVGEDLLSSTTTMGFHDYVTLLSYYLKKYRESEGSSDHGGESSAKNVEQPSEHDPLTVEDLPQGVNNPDSEDKRKGKQLMFPQ